MSDPRSTDSSQADAFRSSLEAWLSQQQNAFTEDLHAALRKGLERFQPDGALLSQWQEQASAAMPFSSGAADSDLAPALDLLEGATSQSDLLRRLLDALTPLVERSALFILKQGLASLYAHRGFEAATPPKPGAVVPPEDLEGLLRGTSRCIRRKGPAYAALLAAVGAREGADVAIFPLRHKRKAVALVLVDSGLRQKVDHPEQVRAIVLVASAMLAALAAGKEDEARPPAAEPPPSAPTQVLAEPVETHAPMDLDPKTRASAERLARVLVADIELYFPDKVALARARGNLYGLLREEVERSRATFIDRFGEEVETQYRIFTTTLVQQLCDGQASSLGSAPWA
jgi:hypothetical protein